MKLYRIAIARIALLSVLLLLSGCHSPLSALTEKDIATNYVASADWGKSYLDLRPDHTFDQVVVRNDHTRTQIRGTWKLNLSAGDTRTWGSITFEPFLSVTNEDQGQWTALNLPSISRNYYGGIEISADPDHGISFDSK